MIQALPCTPSLFIGIDVSKKSHLAAIVSHTLLSTHRFEQCPVVQFDHDRVGFAKLLAFIAKYETQPSQCAVLIENTGHYHRALVEWLLSKGFLVYIIAVPKRVSGLSKTDRADARRLANQIYAQLALGLQVADKTQEARRFIPPTDTAIQLLVLIHNRSELQEQQTRVKNRLTAINDELFPEFTQVFLDPNALIALEIRRHFPTPAIIASKTIEDLCVVKRLRAPSIAKLERLQVLARQSIGIVGSARVAALVLEQEQLIEMISLIRLQLEALDAKITAIVNKSREGKILLSFPYMGPILAATFIACIGNIRNFPTVAKLRKFCGWAPQSMQTGNTFDKSLMTQTGSRLLRQALFLFTMVAISRKETFWSKLYYRLVPLKCSFDPRLKKYRGKMRVVGRVAGQMVSVIYALLKQDADLVDCSPDPQSLPEPQLYDPEIHRGSHALLDKQPEISLA